MLKHLPPYTLHPTTSSVLLPSTPSTTVLGLQSLDSRPKQVVGRRKPAFTIVELLIVIVVIGILAAISIAAYAGISQSARDSSAKASAKQLATKLETTYIQEGSYPAALSDIGIRNTDTTSYQYTSSNTTTPSSWCSTVTVGSTSYYVSSTTSTPTKGGCPGHGQGGAAAITNLVKNPNIEVDTLSLNASASGTGASAQRTTSDKHSGSASMLLTKGSMFTYLVACPNSVGSSGDVVTFSAWIKSSVSSIRLTKRGIGVPFGTATKAITPNQWTRISQSYTVDSGATSFYIEVGWEMDAPTGSTAYIDDIIVTSGSELYNYADGNSPNWIWNGTPNVSTSTGPAL